MGCDGGTIPKRDELVRTKKKKEQKDKTSELNFRWRCCSISQAPLQKPVVACGLGKLYSKDSVITGLLDRSLLPEPCQHLKSLKDVVTLNLTENPAFCRKDEKGDSYVDHQSAPYICPIIGIEMNGKFKFCFFWSCGCVMSERAIKELKSQSCHKCQKPVAEGDLVILNPVDDDLDLNTVRMEARLARAKAEKKAKKASKAEKLSQVTVKVEEGTSGSSSDEKLSDDSKPSSVDQKVVKKEPGIDAKPSGSSIKDKNKLNGYKRGESLGMQAPDLKKAKSSYSVAKDSEASDVFKSIFTSSNKAKSQDRAHWITYNPFYN